MTHPRQRSAVDGGRPLGIPCPEHASTTISGRCYWHHKAAHLRGESVSLEARQWCGFDLPQSAPAGWRQPTEMPAWTRTDDREEYESVDDGMLLVLTSSTADRLNEEEPEGEGVRS